MKEIDDDHAKLFRVVLEQKPRRFSLVVFWLDGDVARARQWLKKHKLAKLSVAVLPRDRRDVRAWRLTKSARNTFIVGSNGMVLGTFVNTTAKDFAVQMKHVTRPERRVAALVSRLAHHDVKARLRAAWALGNMGREARAAAPALKQAANDKSATVAAAALQALRSVQR